MEFVMNYIADIVIIAILLIFFIVGMVKGFLKQALGLVGTLAAFIIAFYFCRQLADFIIANTTFKAQLAAGIADFLGLPDTMVEAENATAALADTNLPAFIISAIDTYIQDLNETTVNISVVVSEALSEYIIVFASFIVIFIGVKIASLLLRLLTSMVKKIKAVKFVDKLIGAAVGLVQGLLIVYTLLYLVDILTFDFMVPVQEAVANSQLATYLSEYNPMIFFLAPILAITGGGA
ncbi:MAG: CvpA family protein [Clostridia bacterium]|nr:CvpA family protein [Clostridia bacterium]